MVIGMTSDFQLKPKHFLTMLWNSRSYLNLLFKLLWHVYKASLTLVWKRVGEKKGGGKEKPGGDRCPSRDGGPCAPLGLHWYPRWEAAQYFWARIRVPAPHGVSTDTPVQSGLFISGWAWKSWLLSSRPPFLTPLTPLSSCQGEGRVLITGWQCWRP